MVTYIPYMKCPTISTVLCQLILTLVKQPMFSCIWHL